MTPRRLDLRDVAENPDRLLDAGYIRRDETTTDTLRAVVYEKAICSDESQLKLLVQIHFSFNGVYLEALDRQMEPEDNRYFDEESEHPISVGALKLDIDSLGEVERLVALLKPGISLW